MDIQMLEAMGFTPEKIMQNHEMLRKFIPILDDLKKTFLKEGETDLIVMGALENNEPIIRLVAVKLSEDRKGLTICRNITKPSTNPEAPLEPFSWNAFDFLKLIATQKQEEEGQKKIEFNEQ